MNIIFDLFLKSLKSDTHINIWNKDQKIVFSGKAYKLYDNENTKKWVITYLNYGFVGIDILIKEV